MIISTMPKPKYTKVLDECSQIAEEREGEYGEIRSNLEEIQEILSSNFEIDMLLDEIVKVFIATKIAREKYKHKEDNIKDLINYYAILLKLTQENMKNQNKHHRENPVSV